MATKIIKTAAVPNPNKPLTDMQRAFVTNLVNNGLTATGAARQAGFLHPQVQGLTQMKKPHVAAAIARARAEYAVASGMTKKKVVEGFSEAIDLGRIKGDPLSMIAGWREIGKLCGFYEPTKTKIEVSVSGQVLVQRLNSMTDEELLALAEGNPNVLEGEFHVIGD